MTPTGREIALWLSLLNRTVPKYKAARTQEFLVVSLNVRANMTVGEVVEMRQAIERMTRGIA